MSKEGFLKLHNIKKVTLSTTRRNLCPKTHLCSRSSRSEVSDSASDRPNAGATVCVEGCKDVCFRNGTQLSVQHRLPPPPPPRCPISPLRARSARKLCAAPPAAALSSWQKAVVRQKTSKGRKKKKKETQLKALPLVRATTLKYRFMTGEDAPCLVLWLPEGPVWIKRCKTNIFLYFKLHIFLRLDHSINYCGFFSLQTRVSDFLPAGGRSGIKQQGPTDTLLCAGSQGPLMNAACRTSSRAGFPRLHKLFTASTRPDNKQLL